MGKLIKIHDIEEFSDVKCIPDSAVSENIISNIRLLDEKKEIEKYIQQLLYDPNETPHGPTEIADILTTHLHVRGEKKFAAFVLKGKSSKTVTSKKVSYQFMELRQTQSLNLIVFGAVGHIHDDAYRDFTQTAHDLDSDYLILDAHDLARLFIAYEKICPKDGTTYDNIGVCKEGHIRDEGLHLEMEVREKARFTIINQKDLSHIGAKRYSLAILVDKHYPKDILRDIIKQVTKHYKYSTYYRDEKVEKVWGNNPAHVIWLHLAYDLEDIRNSNWFCRTSWIDPDLPDTMRPSSLNGNEKLDDIEIFWNDNFKSLKQFFEKFQGTKEEYLSSVKPILNNINKYAKTAIIFFKQYKNNEIPESIFIEQMQTMWNSVDELFHESGNTPLPTEDCKDFDFVCNTMFAIIHNMFLYYSPKGIEKWPSKNRDWMMQKDITKLEQEIKNLKYEEQKIH
jgi:hypothetical protein